MRTTATATLNSPPTREDRRGNASSPSNRITNVGSFGMAIHRIAYARRPMPPASVSIRNARRTRGRGLSRWSAMPADTPAIIARSVERYSFRLFIVVPRCYWLLGFVVTNSNRLRAWSPRSFKPAHMPRIRGAHSARTDTARRGNGTYSAFRIRVSV